MSNAPLPIFSALGIEIEYMLVDGQTLAIQPASDSLLAALGTHYPTSEVVLGDIGVSNELVLHVIELKNNGPRPPYSPISEQFQHAILQMQPALLSRNLQLLPTGAHPWMNPHTETSRWPHGNREIYTQYDRIFDCKGHGWANLQSMHVNLPFANDEEFCALHNTLRLLLPLLPALAASSPLLDGKPTNYLDSRLHYYSNNQRKIPLIAGEIIPEFIQTPNEYQERILQPMYQAIAPYDPEGILQAEWLNSRGVIPKFEYGALEVRVLDTQECVNHDIAIARTIHAIAQTWCEAGYYPMPPRVNTAALKAIYDKTLQLGDCVRIDDTSVLKAWQLPTRTHSARDVWFQLISRASTALSHTDQVALEHILTHGNLSQRILRACKQQFTPERLRSVYQELAECLLNNSAYSPQ